MAKKWTILTPESRAQVTSILRNIQRYFLIYSFIRPVLMTIKNETRRATAQSIIDATINKIDMQLEKIPLPPGSKDRHFDFERIINENVPYCLRF